MAEEKHEEIRVSPPGPKSTALIGREKQAVSPAHYHYLPIAIERGNQHTVEDADGNRYLDFTAGAAVMAVGFRHPEVVDAIVAQTKKLVGHSLFFGTFDPVVRLAEKVKELIPWPALKEGKLAFGASGSEAVEIALFLARRSQKPNVLALFPSYHGRTLAANALTGMRASFRRNTASLAPGIIHAPYPYGYRCPFKCDYPDCSKACVGYVEALLDMLVPPEEVCAFIMEPVGGSGGYQVPPSDYVPAVKKLAEKHGFLFIADEIQTGFGRTGKMFAMEHWGVEPDLIALGKPLGGGLPVGAVLARKEQMDDWEPGGWGSTFGGNVLVAAAGHATLSIVQRERLHDNAAAVGEHLLSGLSDMMAEHPLIGDVRGKGLMLAMELVKDRATKAPTADAARMLVDRCLKRGLLVSTCGTYGNCVRLLPPLTIDTEIADRALELLDQSLKEVASA